MSALHCAVLFSVLFIPVLKWILTSQPDTVSGTASKILPCHIPSPSVSMTYSSLQSSPVWEVVVAGVVWVGPSPPVHWTTSLKMTWLTTGLLPL